MGETGAVCVGRAWPSLSIVVCSTSCHGHKITKDPSKNPTSSASVAERARDNTKLRNRLKLSNPTPQPAAKISNGTASRSATAVIIGPYIPSSNKIKLPEIPGKIIAQIAIAPLRIMYQCASTLATVSIFDVSALGGPIQTITLGLLAGFGADYSLSRLNK